MDEVYTIYYNSFGIVFKWKRCTTKDINKIQLVFRDTGLYLTLNELTLFSKLIDEALSKPLLCKDCKKNESCKSILLETPITQVSFVMAHHELIDLQDLMSGTLFQFALDDVLQKQIIKRYSC